MKQADRSAVRRPQHFLRGAGRPAAAEFASWYELFPRSVTHDPGSPRHIPLR